RLASREATVSAAWTTAVSALGSGVSWVSAPRAGEPLNSTKATNADRPPARASGRTSSPRATVGGSWPVLVDRACRQLVEQLHSGTVTLAELTRTDHGSHDARRIAHMVQPDNVSDLMHHYRTQRTLVQRTATGVAQCKRDLST